MGLSDMDTAISTVCRNYRIQVSKDRMALRFQVRKTGQWVRFDDLVEFKGFEDRETLWQRVATNQKAIVLSEIPVDRFTFGDSLMRQGVQWVWQGSNELFSSSSSDLAVNLGKQRGTVISDVSVRKEDMVKVVGSIGGGDCVFGPTVNSPLTVLVQSPGAGERDLLFVVAMKTTAAVFGLRVAKPLRGSPTIQYYSGPCAKGSLIAMIDCEGTWRVFQKPR